MNISHHRNNNPNNIRHHNNVNNNNNQACAACKYQRKKCAPDCLLAPYFPHDRQRQFLNAHKLFGVKKMTDLIKHLDQRSKDEAMRSVIYESDMRASEPVGGCCRYIQQLQAQIKFYEAERDLVLQQLAVFRSHHQQHLNLYNSANNIAAVVDTPSNQYQYLQNQPEGSYVIVNDHAQEHQKNNDISDVSLQDDVGYCWASLQDSKSLTSLLLQKTKNDDISGDYLGDHELYNDQKSLSSAFDANHYDHERNEIGFEPQELVDHHSDGRVLFKLENSIMKAEADCIQQDRDLKGAAATLFTLTNCAT